ncbi:hypothetical protein PGB90_005281 [Kerria lacca]
MYLNVEKKLLLSRAILTPQNVKVNKKNNSIVDLLPRVLHECYSIDSATLPGVDKLEKAEEEATLQHPTEYLNSVTLSGILPYKLKLKLRCIVILICNLSVSDGLYNRTRLIFRDI